MDAEAAGKLKQYEDQLAQVRSLLSGQPDNEELRKLEKDLADIIQMTRDLYDKSAAAAAGGAGAQSAGAVGGAGEDGSDSTRRLGLRPNVGQTSTYTSLVVCRVYQSRMVGTT